MTRKVPRLGGVGVDELDLPLFSSFEELLRPD